MKKVIVGGIISFILFIGIPLLFQECSPGKEKSIADDPVEGGTAYVGDAKCKGCHKKEYGDWLESDHYKSMMPANDSTIAGNFNNAVYTADGVTSRFFKRENKFYINTQSADGNNADFEVLYTFGFKPLQQYLIAFPGGRMQAARVSWDVEKKRWFNQYANTKIDFRDWLHWTKGGQNWNTMCADCHSTNLQKNYMPESDSFHTTYSIMNVSCENCHGGGSVHINYVESKEYIPGKIKGNYLITGSSDKSNTSQLNMCAPCHARKSNIAATFLHTGELMDNIIPQIPSTDFFYADGQVNEEDYTYTSFLQSKMYHNNVKCSNCHNPHSGKILFPNNQLCGQCHSKEKYDTPSHTNHLTNSSGASCISCHMPGKLYMGVDYRHDHSFRVPRPDISVKENIPNACNNCHSNKSFEWSANAVKKWFGDKRAYHFADDLVPGSKNNMDAQKHLLKLINEVSTPAIVQATAAFYLQRFQTPESLQALLKCLQHKDAQVRFRALKSLSRFPEQTWVSSAGPLLTDPVRAVRIAAAELFSLVKDPQITEQYRAAYASAKNELMNYMYYQLDFPTGNLSLANYYKRTNDPANAEKYYLRTLKMDSLLNAGRVELSGLYNNMNKNKEALMFMQEALKIQPKDPYVWYNLGLLQNEMNDKTNALKSFAASLKLDENNLRLYYNYGMLLHQTGQKGESESILEKGISKYPEDADLLYALAFVCIEHGNKNKAAQIVIKLKSVAPNNPDYQQLYRNFGI